MLHAIIMAGGAGTRFWPASRQAKPKQLLDLVGRGTMIQMTVSRLGDLVAPERVMVVTNQRLVDSIAAQLPDLPRSCLLGEPCKRDTAPCIGWSALRVLKVDPAATMVVMPADHVIGPDSEFQAAISRAEELVEEDPSRLVTFGIKPSYAAESFGYIERGGRLSSDTQATVFHVHKFQEKPKLEVAQKYVESGDFYWNSGIFVWKAQRVIDELSKRQPKMLAHLQSIVDAEGSDNYCEVLDTEFAAIEGISVDYAIMEHADEVVVVEAPFQWDDVGSWQSLTRLAVTDDRRNTTSGKHLEIDTENTIVRGADDHLIVTLGLRDCIVVHTPDATLVANKHHEESVREIVKLLEERGWQEYL